MTSLPVAQGSRPLRSNDPIRQGAPYHPLWPRSEPHMVDFVTGGTGFLGTRVVAELLRRNRTVRCLVRPTSDVTPLRAVAEQTRGSLEIIRGNLGRPETYAAALDGCD